MSADYWQFGLEVVDSLLGIAPESVWQCASLTDIRPLIRHTAPGYPSLHAGQDKREVADLLSSESVKRLPGGCAEPRQSPSLRLPDFRPRTVVSGWPREGKGYYGGRRT
eukprot:668978-Amphidinium_carterae.2